MLAIRKLRALAIAGGLSAAMFPFAAIAHPMPDTEITVDYAGGGMYLTIHVPAEDLNLVMPNGLSLQNDVLSDSEESALKSYFGDHLVVFDASGTDIAVTIDGIKALREENADVGPYEEIEVKATVDAESGQSLVLEYDGVLHQVANHRALVYRSDGERLGAIRFDLAKRRATPLLVQVP